MAPVSLLFGARLYPSLKPLLIGRGYVDRLWRYDFYIDDTERLLIMAEVNTDIAYIAARGLDLANIANDHADFDAGWRCCAATVP